MVGGNGGVASTADHGEGEVAQGGHDLERFAAKQAHVILIQGDVADVVADCALIDLEVLTRQTLELDL